MELSSDKIIRKEYIMLDWNVIKYLKSPRGTRDSECKNVIELIRKRYEFPFCEAHLRDLAKSYSEQNMTRVNDDLCFLQRLSNGVVIAVEDKSESFYLTEYSTDRLFQEIINTDVSEPSITPEMTLQSTFKVDMDALHQNHPMRNMLENNGGVYNPESMSTWLSDLFDPLFNETDDYKRFREYLTNLKSDLLNENNCMNFHDRLTKKMLLPYVMPLLDSLEIENEDALADKWKDVITKWLLLQFNGKIPFGALITTAYNMLDLHPLFKEKLKNRKNTLSNITRDSKMIYYASSSKYFTTEDKNCTRKAAFVFKVFNCNTKVMNIEEFIQIFS